MTQTDDRTSGLYGPWAVEWRVERGLVPYEEAVAAMEARAAGIAAGESPELVWLVEHSPIYTAGTSARPEDLRASRFPIHVAGRGGQLTYHGPGQRVVYVLIDLRRRKQDVRLYVESLEAWVVALLAEFGLAGFTRPGRVGVWVERPDKPRGLSGEPAEDKIAAIGLRLRRWVSFHGLALNVSPDLSHFSGIAPCGITQSHLGVTSLTDLGVRADMAAVDAALRRGFETFFGPTLDAEGPPRPLARMAPGAANS